MTQFDYNIDIDTTLVDAWFAEASEMRTKDADAIQYLIGEGAENAAFCVRAEKSAPADHYESIFKSSIGVLLSSGEYNEFVVSWFTKRGVTF